MLGNLRQREGLVGIAKASTNTGSTAQPHQLTGDLANAGAFAVPTPQRLVEGAGVLRALCGVLSDVGRDRQIGQLLGRARRGG
jgi:hypothetical protein